MSGQTGHIGQGLPKDEKAHRPQAVDVLLLGVGKVEAPASVGVLREEGLEQPIRAGGQQGAFLDLERLVVLSDVHAHRLERRQAVAALRGRQRVNRVNDAGGLPQPHRGRDHDRLAGLGRKRSLLNKEVVAGVVVSSKENAAAPAGTVQGSRPFALEQGRPVRRQPFGSGRAPGWNDPSARAG